MSSGFYKYRCKYFLTHNCPNWVYCHGHPCALCLVNPPRPSTICGWKLLVTTRHRRKAAMRKSLDRQCPPTLISRRPGRSRCRQHRPTSVSPRPFKGRCGTPSWRSSPPKTRRLARTGPSGKRPWHRARSPTLPTQPATHHERPWRRSGYPRRWPIKGRRQLQTARS